MPVLYADSVSGSTSGTTFSPSPKELPPGVVTVVVSGSAYRAPGDGKGPIGFDLQHNGKAIGSSRLLAAEGFAHMTLPSIMVKNVIVKKGKNDFSLQPTPKTIIDAQDTFFLMLIK